MSMSLFRHRRLIFLANCFELTSENSTVNQGNIQFMQLLVSSPLLKNNGVIKWNWVKPSRAFERAHFDILKILDELGRFPLERKIPPWISGNFQLQMKQQFPATYPKNCYREFPSHLIKLPEFSLFRNSTIFAFSRIYGPHGDFQLFISLVCVLYTSLARSIFMFF